jgi:Fe-S-cluster-containing hydrogenase component 2
MKVKMLGKKPELCTACHECENTCSVVFFKTQEIGRARLRINEDPAKKEKCIITCTQCGVCISICPTEAISRNKAGIVVIDKAKCVGCLSCVGFCPEEAMFQYKDDTLPFKCISCGQCAKKCTPGAIFLTENEVA